MLDIVSAENLPKPRGVKKTALASTLKNFKAPKSAGEATACSRMRDTLLYSPSYEFDDGIFKDLKKSGGAIAFVFRDILAEKGFRRGIMISKMRLAFSSCRKAGCGFVVCTMAQDGNGLRNRRELEAFMSILGMTEHEKKFAVQATERLAGR